MTFLTSLSQEVILAGSENQQWQANRNLQITPAQVTNRLGAFSKNSNDCLLTGGISKSVFEKCYGPGYSSYSQKYSQYYKELLVQVVKNLKANLFSDCVTFQEDCGRFYDLIAVKLAQPYNVEKDLRLAGKDFNEGQRLPSKNFHTAMRKLVADYNQFLSARLRIAKELRGSIKKIQTYIKATGVQTDFDYLTIDTSAGLDEIDVNIKPLSDDEEADFEDDDEGNVEVSETDDGKEISYIGIDEDGNSVIDTELEDESLNSQIKRFIYQETEGKKRSKKSNLKQSKEEFKKKLRVNKNRFFQSLVKESESLKLLQFYLGSGRVDPRMIDLSEQPTVLIKKIKSKGLAVGNSL